MTLFSWCATGTQIALLNGPFHLSFTKQTLSGVFAKLRDVEDTVNIFESPLEIQPVGNLPNMLQHHVRSNKPSPKLSSPNQVKYFQRKQHFFSHLMLLKSVVLVKVAF